MVLGVLGVLDRTDCWLGFRVWGLPRRLLSVDELLAESRRAQHALPPKHGRAAAYDMAAAPDMAAHTAWHLVHSGTIF